MNIVDACLKSEGMFLRKVTKSILTNNNYLPECTSTPALDKEGSSYYASMVGVLRWMVDIVIIDITFETSMVLYFVALPCEGQLHNLFHIFYYTKVHHNSRIIIDPTHHNIDEKYLSSNN